MEAKRTRVDEQIVVLIAKTEREALERLAEEEGRSLSGQARHLLRQQLKRQKVSDRAS